MNVNGICFTLGVILLLYRRGDSDVSAVTDKNSYPENRNPQVQRNNVRVRKIIEAKSSSSEIAERTDRDSEISGQYILVYRTNVTNVALKTRHLPQRLNCWKNLRNTASNTTTPISLLFSFAQKKFKESVISGVFPDMLDDLTSDEDILIIEPDFWVKSDVMEVNYTEGMWGTWQKTNAKASTSLWGLDRINQKSLPLDNNINHNFTGYGVDVYILDSGILSSHEQFTHGDRAICSFNAIAKDNTDCYDGTGHGTHVAGSVGGTSYGVTKGVQLLAVKVLDSNGSGLASRVIAGIDHVVNKKKSRIRPTVVNMSFGGKQSLALNEAVDAAVEEGIVFVASAGNDARPACQQSPASSQLAITVGASNQRDRGALYSNFGKCIDIFGPGSDVLSSWNLSDNATMILSGTSMAAPHVAGIAALYLEQDPTMTPAQVWNAMKADAIAGTMLFFNLHGLASSPNLFVNTQSL